MLGAAGLAVGVELTKDAETDLSSNLMGGAATLLVGVMGPLMNAAAASVRSGTAAQGLPAARVTAWVAYATSMTGAVILLANGLAGDATLPTGLITATGAVGLLSLVLFAADDFKSAAEVQSLYPENKTAGVSLFPMVTAARSENHSTTAFLGLMGRF